MRRLVTTTAPEKTICRPFCTKSTTQCDKWIGPVVGFVEHPGLGCMTTTYVPDRPSAKVARTGCQLSDHGRLSADNVPDRPSAKVAPSCLVPTKRPWHLKLKLSLSQKVALRGRKLSPNLGRQCIWAELHETGGLSATLAVNRLRRQCIWAELHETGGLSATSAVNRVGRCATRPSTPAVQ